MPEEHRIKLTAGEKVLLHLYEYTKYVDHFEVPFAVTQDGIAEAIGILRSHVPRTIKNLMDKGYVEEKLAHVIGSERRRKVYFLTTPGIAHAKKIRDDVKAVEWIFGIPEEKEERILKEVISAKSVEEGTAEKKDSTESKFFKPGICYLIKFITTDFVHNLLRRELKNARCLVLSRMPPQRIKSIIESNEIKSYWLSGIESEESVSATNLVRIFSIIKSFSEQEKGGTVVIDGIEYLIAQNGLDAVMKFIHMVEDFIISNNLTLVIPLSPPAVDPGFLALLERELEIISEESIEKAMVKRVVGVEQSKAESISQKAGVSPSLSEFLEKISDEAISFHSKIPSIAHFFGRQEELKLIDELIASKTHRFIVIHGIAGMGKTTLGAKVARNYLKKCNVFWMRIYDWVTLRTIISEFGEILFLMKRQHLKNYMETKPIIDIGEVCGILERDLKNANALIFIDDFQKVNEEIKNFFNSVLDAVANIEGIKFIILSRHPVPFYDIRDIEQKKIVAEIELKGLDKESTFAFLRMKGFPETMFERIYALTKGHPLALEFMKSVEDVKQTSSGIYKFIFNEIFMKLNETEKSLLKKISVFRHPLPIEAISYTFPTYTSDTFTHLINRGLLSQTGENLYEVHELVREFFYNMMSVQEKNEAHKCAAQYYLEIINRNEVFSERTYLEASYHLYKTKDFEKLVDIITTNSFRLIQQGYIHEMLELIENLPEIAFSSRIDMYVLKGTIYDIMARWDDSLKAYNAALPIAKNLLDAKDKEIKMMKLYERIAHVLYNKSEWLDAIKYYQESLKIAKKLEDTIGIVNAKRGLGLVYWRTGEYAKAKEHVQDALKHAEKINDTATYVNLKIEMGMIHDELGDFNTAATNYTDAIKYAEENYFYYELARAQHNLGGTYLEMHDFEKAQACYEKALELFKKLGYFREIYWTMFNLAEVYIRMSGDIQKAEALLNEAYINLKRIGDMHGVASVYRYLGMAKRHSGDYEKAEEYLLKSIELLEKLSLPHRLAESYFELGLVYKHQLRKDEAIECFEKAYAIFEKIGARVYYLRKLYDTMKL